MPHIASTLTCDQSYTTYQRNGDILVELDSIVIKGGFGLADKNFVTPTGAKLTEVTKEELDKLKQHSQFQAHLKNGFLSIIEKGSADGDKAASDMNIRSKDQPLNPASYADKNNKAPEALSVSTGRI